MGYCSDVRILIRESDFNELLIKQKDNSFITCLDVKETRIGKDDDGNDVKYTYFGWNCVKYYSAETEAIDDFVKELDEYHYVRIGESWDDVDEYYNLNQTDVRGIQVCRHFEDMEGTK
ncbi:MAG: hypothetical protein LBM01_02600 [Christensenellaceae bacterium]|jgi:hypothetical protein|nr:hypothetical protein [Christensenellaceae bacterium]